MYNVERIDRKKNCSAQWDKTEQNHSVVGGRFCIFGSLIKQFETCCAVFVYQLFH